MGEGERDPRKVALDIVSCDSQEISLKVEKSSIKKCNASGLLLSN
jgi:hypothetical protein